MAVMGPGGFGSSQPRKKGFGQVTIARHVPREGIMYLIPMTKRSRNHPVMLDGDVGVVEVDVVLAR
jgi:hypothetical protein